MVAMPQFVCQCTDACKNWLKVCHHSRLICAQPHTQCPISLAHTGFGINPTLTKCPRGKLGQPWRVSTKLLNNKCRCFFKFPYPLAVSDWRKQIIPGKAC